jgi:hypothetical protein
MRRLPVTEPFERHKFHATLASVRTERNRLMSWDGPVQRLTKPADVIPSSKSSITLRPLGFVSKITKLFFTSLANIPYALFKLGYEIAKLVTMGLSKIRRLLFLKK